MNATPASESQGSLGHLLRQRRQELGLTQAVVATRAEISAGYYSALENGRCVPPSRQTLKRILAAINLCVSETQRAERLAALGRGIAQVDVDLPEEAQALIADIRKHAGTINPRFLRGLRTKIREAVS